MAQVDASVFGGGGYSGDNFPASLSSLLVNIFMLAQVAQRRVTGGHRQRISRERSRLIDRAERSNQIHDFRLGRRKRPRASLRR